MPFSRRVAGGRSSWVDGAILCVIDRSTAWKKVPFWSASSAWSFALPTAPLVKAELLEEAKSKRVSCWPFAIWLTKVVSACDWASTAWAKFPSERLGRLPEVLQSSVRQVVQPVPLPLSYMGIGWPAMIFRCWWWTGTLPETSSE